MLATTDKTDPSIGDIISRINNLSAEQIEQILQHQKATGLKFGEAAVDLGLAQREDVLWALSQQFHYPYQGREAESVSDELVVATDPFSTTSEFFRDIRTQLLSSAFQKGRPERLALAVCSTDIGDGKTFFCANLAVAFSQLSGRTLLIDADMRTPRQQKIFNVDPNQAGLSNILSGRAEANVLRPIDSLPNLYLLPVGVVPPNPLELIQGEAFDNLIANVLPKFDYVIIDTPAAIHGADARVIAAKAGAALVVGREGVTRVDALKPLCAQLKKNCAVFAGALINDHTS